MEMPLLIILNLIPCYGVVLARWFEQQHWIPLAQDVCAIRGSTVQGGLGPFGLLTLSSENLEEYTPVFFRVFKTQDKYKVLMCSDASRSSIRNHKKLYKPSFAGYVETNLTDKRLSLRSLIDHSVVKVLVMVERHALHQGSIQH
ncbi:hypothetical protein KY285_005672 [Solanum tuberosum]|nr:hypothetical protein KY285_005672 [Solanum tuberosum]